MVLNAEERQESARGRGCGHGVVVVLSRAPRDPGSGAHGAAGASPRALFALRHCRYCVNPSLGFGTTDCGSPEDLLRADSAK